MLSKSPLKESARKNHGNNFKWSRVIAISSCKVDNPQVYSYDDDASLLDSKDGRKSKELHTMH